jgi:hypothetical protein
MKTKLFFIVILQIATSSVICADSEVLKEYKTIGLKSKIDFEVFEYALNGFKLIKNKTNDSILTIIDYSKPSTEYRLYIIDLKNKKLISESLVAHGRNSGENKAIDFSNVKNSKKSSLGFYKTAETYTGKHGYSLKLDGLEKNINDNARERAIVIHGAWYVSEEFIDKHGRLGRSWGCPALPIDMHKKIIDTIKNGSYLYIHGDDKNYKKTSNFNF